MRVRLLLIVGVLGSETLDGFTAHAQVPAREESSAGRMVNLGGRGLAGGEAEPAAPKKDRETLQFSAKAGFASDYIYRGTTLSARQPAVGAGIEASVAQFYAGVTVAKVRLPTNPNLEIATSAGVRPTLGRFDLDFGWTYFSYPGKGLGPETPTIDYWEAAFRADTKFAESWQAAAGVAYSPNVSNTGAWSTYTAAGLGYGMPANVLPFDIGMSVTAGGGYSWFGTQRQDLGGFRLPNYLNWQAGVTFTRKLLNLDLRYYDTNLSRENCFVFTGDPGALPTGRVDPVTNPDGLASTWCGATFVAKVWFALN